MQPKQPHQHKHSGPRGPWSEHLVEDEGMTLEQALQVLATFECLPYRDPKHGHVATIIKRNKEIHFAAYRRYRKKVLISHARIAEFLQPLLDKEVFLVTKLAKGEDPAFIERLGFQRLGATIDGTTTYILNSITYPGAKKCDRSVH
jgi:hypothetical protein